MWSKLKKPLQDLFVPELNLQVQCAVYRKKTQHSVLELPRYFFSLDKEIIWDYPKDFIDETALGVALKRSYTYDSLGLVVNISETFRDYLNTPKDQLIDYPDDIFSVVQLLKTADRRLSLNKLLKMNWTQEGAKKILAKRGNLKK